MSLLMCGIPFVDLANLKKSQLRGDILSFERQKTHRRVTLRLSRRCLALIKRYAAKDGPYLLDIYHDPKNSMEKTLQYNAALRSYNRYLKKIAEMVGMTDSLTSYTVRHTWASKAYACDVSVAVIAGALGHSNTRTTQIYLTEIDNRRVTKASRDVFNRMFGKVIKRLEKRERESQSAAVGYRESRRKG